MKTRVQKWGKLLIIPVVQIPLTLDDLLAGITENNLYHEVDPGTPQGNEVV